MRRIQIILFLALCATLLSACGNKGPLVLPDQGKDKNDQTTPSAATEKSPKQEGTNPL